SRHLTGYLLALGLTTCLLICVLSGWRWCHEGKGAKLPPGPWGIPLLGNLAILRRKFYREKCIEWVEKYGPVFRIKLGVTSIVIVNDFESIKEVLSKRECLFRPRNWIFKNAGGVATLNGGAWQENRRFCIRTLRELTYGKNSLLGQIGEEFQNVLDRVEEAKGQPIRMQPLLLPSVSNNIVALVLGSRYQPNDPKQKQLEQYLETFVNLFSKVTPVHPLP
ncbi:unnamed protein product, partial [Ixodes hexagonus]